jgi:hypothetical protein
MPESGNLIAGNHKVIQEMVAAVGPELDPSLLRG